MLAMKLVNSPIVLHSTVLMIVRILLTALMILTLLVMKSDTNIWSTISHLGLVRYVTSKDQLDLFFATWWNHASDIQHSGVKEPEWCQNSKSFKHTVSTTLKNTHAQTHRHTPHDIFLYFLCAKRVHPTQWLQKRRTYSCHVIFLKIRFQVMPHHAVRPNVVTYNVTLNLCAAGKARKFLKWWLVNHFQTWLVNLPPPPNVRPAEIKPY